MAELRRRAGCTSSPAIAWIGSSFYFVALDLGLREAAGICPSAPMARNGRSMAAASITSRNIWWRRPNMPEHLTWFKWEATATWLSGFADALYRLLRRCRSLS